MLKIRLSIQSNGLHVRDAGWTAGFEQNQIGRKTLILVNFDDLSDLQVLPLLLLEAVSVVVQLLRRHPVL